MTECAPICDAELAALEALVANATRWRDVERVPTPQTIAALIARLRAAEASRDHWCLESLEMQAQRDVQTRRAEAAEAHYTMTDYTTFLHESATKLFPDIMLNPSNSAIANRWRDEAITACREHLLATIQIVARDLTSPTKTKYNGRIIEGSPTTTEPLP